jgi:hypothetical protein
MQFRKVMFALPMALALLLTGIYAQSPTSKPCGPTATEIYNFRERCAKQAYDEFLRGGNKVTDHLSNHYNAAMDKCFMLITRTWVAAGYAQIDRTLTDAYDRQMYADSTFRIGGTPVETERVTCDVSLPSGEKKYCRSEDEFQELISVYMGKGGLK